MNATACPERETLEAYVRDGPTDQAVDAHLDECAECQAALEEFDAALNEPFANLRRPPARIDWQAPYRLVTQAEGLLQDALEGDRSETRRLPYQLG